MKAYIQQKSSTVFLRLIVYGMGIAVLLLCAVVLPEIAVKWPEAFPYAAMFHYPVVIGLVATTIPFYTVLYQTMKLLGYIDRDSAFSRESVASLRVIKWCAGSISTVYALLLPLVYYIADMDDAPGLMVIGLICTFAPLTIAVFAAVLQKLLSRAMEIQSENELTV